MKDKNPSVRQSTEMLGMFVTAVRPTLTDILYVWCGGGEGRGGLREVEVMVG